MHKLGPHSVGRVTGAAAVILLLTIGAAYSSRHQAGVGRAGRVDMSDVKTLVGRTVTIRGRAIDAHGGAVVMLDDETPIYIPVLEYWPPELVGTQVEVRGVLKKRKLTPNPDDEPISHGAHGEDFVLDNASWRRVAN